MPRWRKFSFYLLVCMGAFILAYFAPIPALVHAQQPTGAIPTVTGTPSGPIVTVYLDQAQIKVYAGPSQYFYPAVGVLLAGQQMPALGISEDDKWIMIRYPGVQGSVAWVYAPYVSLRGGRLSLVAPPPTPTLVSTPTLDPTLAAAFIAQNTPTRLPTFTEPAPLVIATFADETEAPARVPAGLAILGFGFIGSLGALISFLRGR